MFEMKTARANILTHIPANTTHVFDVALHDATTASLESMAELQDAVCACVRSLRDGNVEPVQMILAMKACAIDSARRYHPEKDEFPASNVDILIEHIVRWSIVEYYKNVS